MNSHFDTVDPHKDSHQYLLMLINKEHHHSSFTSSPLTFCSYFDGNDLIQESAASFFFHPSAFTLSSKHSTIVIKIIILTRVLLLLLHWTSAPGIAKYFLLSKSAIASKVKALPLSGSLVFCRSLMAYLQVSKFSLRCCSLLHLIRASFQINVDSSQWKNKCSLDSSFSPHLLHISLHLTPLFLTTQLVENQSCMYFQIKCLSLGFT